MKDSGDYISREAAFEAVFGQFCASSDETEEALNSAIEDIKRIPAADVRPVVRGKWRERRFSEDVYGAECSVCHTTWDYGTNFCPNCGADMRQTSMSGANMEEN